MFGLGRKDTTKREIIINAENLETRVAVMESGKLEEFQIEHPTRERIVGSIFKGKIQNLEHDLQAAFVDIGMKKNAFLHYWDMIPDDVARLEQEDGVAEDSEGGEGTEGNDGNERNGRDSRDSRNGRSGRGRRGGRGGRSGRRGRSTSRRRRYSNEEIAKRFPPGAEIVVQVTKGPIGTKGPRVTASLSIPGRYLVMMPGSKLKGVSRKIGDGKERQRLKKIVSGLPIPEDAGIIVRTVAQGARKRSFILDLRGLASIWEELQAAMRDQPAPSCLYQEPDLVSRVVRDWLTEDIDRIVVDSRERYDQIREVAGRVSRRARSRTQLYEGELPVFNHYEVERQLEEAFRRKVMLDSGACIVFDETEALIAIDVNTGRHKGQGSQEQAILAVNTEAVEEVARQLRLRNIGGLVVIDLIDMRAKKHQNAVYRTMKAALRRDRARVNVLPISDLGIMEMTRQRAEESILSAMYIGCPYCRGRGNVKSPLSMSVDIQRQISTIVRKTTKAEQRAELEVAVHPTVLSRLRREDEQFLVDLQSKFGGGLTFKSDPSRHLEFFEIKNATTGDILYSSAER